MQSLIKFLSKHSVIDLVSILIGVIIVWLLSLVFYQPASAYTDDNPIKLPGFTCEGKQLYGYIKFSCEFK